MEELWDAIVIGSGIGGLTTAGLLAVCAGKRVLVLEKHTEPGGLTHVFRRDGASWDVGLHYVGEMESGTLARNLFDRLSAGKLAWNKMPGDFENFVYPGMTLTVPSDQGSYQSRLGGLFPGSEVEIDRYFRRIQAARRRAVLRFVAPMLPLPGRVVLSALVRLLDRDGVRTTAEVLQATVSDPKLRAVLATQWGDYGLPPGRSAFSIHALIVGHYLHGAWFPQGGSARIARTFEPGIEAAGGRIFTAQEVVEILTEGTKAVGVRVIDRRGPVPVERVYRAPQIFSNAGARPTFGTLLPVRGPVGRRTERLRRHLQSLPPGLSAVTLYLRLRASARTLGVEGENYWVNADFDHDDPAQFPSALAGHPTHVYLSFPSLKSGEDQFPTAEVVAMVNPDDFRRDGGYPGRKEIIADGLLDLAETAVPGLKDLVIYRELSTPRTVEDYTSHPRGEFYGVPAVPERYKAGLLGPATPVRGLFLTGEDAGSLGIVGALMGGLSAAARALGPSGFLRIMRTVRGPMASLPARPLPDHKVGAVLTAKTRVTPRIWELRFRLDRPWTPAAGQFARVQVDPLEWRDYSIVSGAGSEAVFLISTRTGGQGSRFAETVEVGESTVLEGPLGTFGAREPAERTVFIATGTGLAPLLPLMEKFRREGAADRMELLFGCRTEADNLAARYPSVVPEKTIVRLGRVTEVIPDWEFDPEQTAFYICGPAPMVADTRRILETKGARRVYIENY